MLSYIVPFLINWLLFFVVSFIAVDYGHRYLYDEPPPSFGLRVTLGSILLALLSTFLRPTFDTMFTTGLAWTVLQMLAWVGVFILVYQFQPWHGAGFGVALGLVIPVMSALTITSLSQPADKSTTTYSRPNAPLRRGAGGAPVTPPEAKKDAPAK